MADLGNISQVTLPNGDIAHFKDSTAIERLDNFALKDIHPVLSKTYTNVYCSANSDPAGFLYFGAIHPTSYDVQWSILYRVHATIADQPLGEQISEVYISGMRDTYAAYRTWNEILHTSYRPYYNHLLYRCKQAGITNGYGHLLGLRFQSSWYSERASSARDIDVEILELKNCTFEFFDSMILYANAPGTGSTNYNTRDQFDATTQGNTMSGDRNTSPASDVRIVYSRFKAGEHGVKQYSFVMRDATGAIQSFTTTNGTAATKTKNPTGFRLGGIWYYEGSGNPAADAYMANNAIRTVSSLVDLRYSFNIATTNSLTPGPFYIVGTMHSDHLFYLDDVWWTQTEPTTEDGKVYIFLGTVYFEMSGSTQSNAYRVGFSGWNGAYWYKDGRFQEVVDTTFYAQNASTASNATNADKVNGHTVAKDVPSDAVFTDTTYTLASSGGNGLRLTPSGGSPVYTKVNTQDLVRPTALRGINDVTLHGQINSNRANRLAFLPADQIIIEKTVDGGATWTDAGISDQQKRALFAEVRPGIPLPRINDLPNVLCGIRITITAMKYDVPANTPETQKYNYWNSDHVLSQERYVTLREMYFWISATNNSMGVKVERATGGNSTNWQTAFYDPSFYMTGWSGPDYISFGLNNFGGGTTQTTNFWNYRITLMTKGANGSSTEYGSSTSALTVMEVRGYGESAWSGNSYAMYDHLYSKDDNMNAAFPATVTAKNFNGKINSHTVAKDVPSDAVFTDTTDLSQMTGTLGFAHGGTGQTSGINAANSLLNQLTTGSSTPTDNDYYISQYVGGGTTTTTYHRRPMSAMWTWIKSKIDAAYTNALTKYAGSDSAGGPANNVKGAAGTTNAYRHVWFSDNATETSRNYDDDFKYNPATNSVKVSGAYMTYNATTKSLDFTFDE